MTMEISKEMMIYIDNLPGMAACRDRNCVYQYANHAYGKTHGLAHHLDIVGRTSNDLPSGAAACAALFDEQDRQVMNSGKELRILDIHPYAHGAWSAHLYIKRPWLDAHQRIIGTIGWGTDITHAYAAALSTQFDGCRELIAQNRTPALAAAVAADPASELSLSPREQEILMLILRGKTAKLAAAAVGLSYRTVEQYIDSIKQKFGVRSKIDLIDTAIARGYLNRAASMFSRQLSMVLTNV